MARRYQRFWIFSEERQQPVRSRIQEADFPIFSIYTLRPTIPSVSSFNPMRPPFARFSWYWNINQFAIVYPFRTRLRTRLTLRWRASRRKPWVFGVEDSHLNYRYSCLHAHFYPLQRSLPVHLLRWIERSPTTQLKIESKASVHILAPLYFPRRITRPVSCYAFFKGWLLLSQPPGCHSNSTSFST